MSLIKDKYKRLKPTLDYLSDPVVLAQAWKKSHTYIRTYNWYADTLELDASTFNLEENLIAWGKELSEKSYESSPMRVVPAPKADVWTFENDQDNWVWQPAKTKAKKNKKRKRHQLSEPLRPLAHLTIKDQTIATAMMMCMADAVESAQGETSGKNASSYGNRLYCSWDNELAFFGWGNSTTYSKYFQDYQRFLNRTDSCAKDFSELLDPKQDVYEVHLDMSAFYDSINRETLVSQLRRIVDPFYEIPGSQSESFWQSVRCCFNSWRWEKEDENLNDCLKVQLKSDGLPQGLVASGFFANVYLHEFDLACKSLINASLGDFTIRDYRRYVDDLRLVISVKKDSGESALDSVKHKLIGKLTSLLPAGDLRFNLGKTKLIRWTGESSAVSSQMKKLQQITSGPMDLDSLLHVENSLDSLFLRAEVTQDESGVTCTHPLATVHKIALDVREDTVLRFSANRWVKVFKERRRLADHNSLSELDTAQEVVARRFVACWSKNPALILLLKKGLQLFPSKELLATVWLPLVEKLSSDTPEREQRIAFYCLSEICRYSLSSIKRLSKNDVPSTIDLDEYFTYLCEISRLLIHRPNLPWYLRQQIGLLLVGGIDIEKISAFKDDTLLFHVMMIASGKVSGKQNIVIPACLVAWQMAKNSKVILGALRSWINQLSVSGRRKSLKSIALNNPELFQELVNDIEKTDFRFYDDAHKIMGDFGLTIDEIPDDINELKGKYVLSSAIKSNVNPFIHENALIKLALALVDALKTGSITDVSPQSINIECSDWGSIQNPKMATLRVSKSKPRQRKNMDSRYTTPYWISEGGESHLLYGLGCTLRACAVGSCDFTTQQTLYRQDVSNFYTGLKSSWYKRRMGMMHSPEALVGEAAPMSGWITELLFYLLQWPGLKAENIEGSQLVDLDLSSLAGILKKRLEYQGQLYGDASGTPLYVQHIKMPSGEKHTLRVVTVQSLLPKKKDFKSDNIALDEPRYREKHRNHLGSVDVYLSHKSSDEKHSIPM